MGGVNFTVHPLFVIFGFYYALTGRIFVFVIYTISAVLHELGHSFIASGAGYKLNKITLMPFGAVVKCDDYGMKLSDEVKIALAGPFLNLAIGLFFVATWWIFPETYAFTDTVAEANFSLALINFLPVFPLDGGRVLTALLKQKFDGKRAFKVSKTIGVGTAIFLLAGFIVTLFNAVNFSLLFFSLFVLFGAFSKSKDNVYVKAYTALSSEKLKRGMLYKRQAVDKETTVKKIMSLLDENCVNEIVVFDGQLECAVLSQAKIIKIIEKGEFYQPIKVYI